MKTIVSIVFLFAIGISPSFGQDRHYSFKTKAGKLSVYSSVVVDECVIKLGKKVITKYECSYSPEVLKHIKTSVSPFDEVLVFQNQMIGNMCDGTDIFFLGLNKDGTYKISSSVDIL